MEEDGMCFSRVGAPQEDHIRFFDLAVGTSPATRPENRRQTGDAGSMSSTVTTINIVAADDGAHELLRGVVQFVGRLGAAEHSKRAWAMQRHLLLKSFRGAQHSFVPRCKAVFAIFANERSRQPIVRCVMHNAPPATKGQPGTKSAVSVYCLPKG